MRVNIDTTKRLALHKVSVAIYWLIIWPFVSMIFPSNSHNPAFLKPIGVFFRPETSNVPEGYYTGMSYFISDILPAACFWLVLIGIIILLPSSNKNKPSNPPR